MARVTTVSLVMLLLLALATPGADDKGQSTKHLAGTWKRTAGDNSITFTFKGDSLHAVVRVGDRTTEVEADYGVSKDGVVFGRISHVKKEGEGPSEGELFSFRCKVEDRTLTLSELKTPHDSDEAKELFQGEYHKQQGQAK